MNLRTMLRSLPFLFLVGCAGLQRDCQSCNASSYGADWIVVQYRADGDAINCWQLRGAPVANEAHSDGIWWTGQSGHLVHIGGWYNRVQVERNDWQGAAREVGIDLDRCKGGRYLPSKVEPKLPFGPRRAWPSCSSGSFKAPL